MEKIKTALVQLNCGPVIEENTKAAIKLIRSAAEKGAKFILTPENTCHMRFPAEGKMSSAFSEEDHPALKAYKDLALELDIFLLIGSLSIIVDEKRIANRSYMLSNKGEVISSYDKIHLFDVDLPTGESHRESDNVRAGSNAVSAELPFAKLGMSICYDVRFAYLYRELAQNGASILSVPAAFTVPTGIAHWETLLRARAIETGSFVLAPAQCGEHEGGRKTYGHSLIINPWGEILAEGDDKPGLIMADLNLSEVELARSAIPSLMHDKKIA
jgi:predicted amidohydrolase